MEDILYRYAFPLAPKPDLILIEQDVYFFPKFIKFY